MPQASKEGPPHCGTAENKGKGEVWAWINKQNGTSFGTLIAL